MSLSGKVALVTGGSRGIGSAIAIALAEAGARVALTYQNNHEKAQQVCDQIRTAKGSALALSMRLQERASIEKAIGEIRQAWGDVEILVNNAAMSQEKDFTLLSDDDWDQMFSVNMGGAFRCTQLVLAPMLEKGWGRIINIASIGGQWGGYNQVHYAASKAALINFTRSLARLYSARGITANAVAPGLVATDMTAVELASEAGKEKIRQIPARRIGKAREIGAGVVFLASEAAGYLTGQTLNFNGGMYFG